MRTTARWTLLILLALAPVAEARPLSSNPPTEPESPTEPAEEAAPVEPELPTYEFRWPIPTRVKVEESSLKKGRRAKSRYTITIDPSEDDVLELRYRDFEFVMLEGVDLEDETVKKQMAPTVGLMNVLPPFRIERSGGAIGMGELEEVVKLTGAIDGLDPEIREKTLALLRDPNLGPTMSAAMQGFWTCWVEHWVGFEYTVGEGWSGSFETSLGGNTYPIAYEIEFPSVPDDTPNLIAMRATYVHEGDEFESAMLAWILELMKSAGTEPKKLTPLRKATKKGIYSITFDRETLLPVTAASSEETFVDFEEQPANRQLETHEYRFDWPFAKLRPRGEAPSPEATSKPSDAASDAPQADESDEDASSSEGVRPWPTRRFSPPNAERFDRPQPG